MGNAVSVASIWGEIIVNVKAAPYLAKGDGVTDDSAAFESAIEAGNRIEVPDGEYLIGDVDLTGKYIFGKGTIKKKSASESAFHIKGEGAFVQGLFFEAEDTSAQPNTDIKLGDGSKDIRIEGCTFRSPIYSAIAAATDTGVGGTPYAKRVSGVMVTNCVFGKLDTETLGYTRPLYLHSVDNITIQGNTIRDCAFDAIRLRENDGFVLIDGNQFINIGDSSWPDEQTRDAIDTYWSGANLIITNNIVRKTASIGFDIKGYSPNGSYGSNKVIIANNQIYQCRYSGISVAGDTDYDGAGNYKYIYGVVITGNIVQECNQNNLTGTGSVSSAGIYLSKVCAYIDVSHNQVMFNYARGIFAHNETASKGISKSISITDNTCVNNGQSSLLTTAGGVGIFIAAIESAMICRNICVNDTSLPNAYQQVGITHTTTDNGYTPATKTSIITDNQCVNNAISQILMNSNTDRLNAVAVYERNVVSGSATSFRGAFQNTRSIYFGSAAPTSAEGTFNDGDVFINVSPTDARNISHYIAKSTGLYAYGAGFGTTAQRPALSTTEKGYCYMDTTLAKMIMWNGTAWLV
jgi:hypothetical protein